MNKLQTWLMEEESGQGLVEYALIIVLIALVVAGAMTGLAGALQEKFNTMVAALH